MPHLPCLEDELERAANMLVSWGNLDQINPCPRAVSLLRKRASVLRKRNEPHRAAHRVVFAGKKITKSSQITNADALRKIRDEFDSEHGD